MSAVVREEPTFPPPERGQHDELTYGDNGMGGRVYQLQDATQIDRYWRANRLGNQEERHVLRDVGNEYGKAVYIGCLGPHYAKINTLRVISAPVDSEAQQKAAQLIRRTDEELGVAHAGFMRAVCAEGWTANAWAQARARQHGWEQPDSRFGMAMLLDALRLTRALWDR